MKKIIIVDHHTLFREGLKFFIENEALGEVVALAKSGQEFLDIISTQQPDLVIMDMEMPLINGAETTINALDIIPGLKVIIVTMPGEMEYYLDIMNTGAMGILLKTSGKKEFEKAIKTVLRGENYFSLELLNQITHI